ncbi:hypothetical protein [Lutibacter sp.]|uniref:hypothetical protein n=1 Tax=Lutibacter sp. TaxID=1925666 RepID=UPI00273306FD|nr:hypothetical protein [Lutibacter sp.]MDP3313768.1 hypothetical protein [Lutibacter sp.]
MKQTKSIFNILIVFLFIAQNSFAHTKPIIGIGIVVKKNPGGGYITVPTGNGGGFSTQLEEGEYELSFPQDQLQTSINGIVKANYPKSNYQYDGSGVEMVLDNSAIRVNIKPSQGDRFTIDKQNSIIITVPKGGATLSGKLSWDDAVMQKSEISCPDGFTMQNGECVPINPGNQQERTEGKLKGKIMGGDNSISSFPTVGNTKKSNCSSLNVSLNANGGTSASTGVSNSFSFNPSLGIELQWNHFGIGFDAGTFNTKPNFDFNAYAAPLQNLDFLTITTTKSDWTSTYFMLGPQYTITLSPSQNKESGRHTPFHNKLTFTLALKGGLTINKAPEFSVTDKSTPPKNIASYTAPQDYKKNAFSLKPSIGFDYWISENFALTANAHYLMQTGQKEFATEYRDLTNVNLAPPISPDQFQKNIATAPKVLTNTKGPENYMSFGFGITYRFNKGGGDCDDKSDITSNEAQRKGIQENDLKKIEQRESLEKNDSEKKGWDGSIKGNKAVETTNDATQGKGIKEGGLKKNEIETSQVDGDGTKATGGNPTGRKGWDGSVKGKNIAEKGINENGLKKNEVETVSDGPQKIAIKEQGVKKSDVEQLVVSSSNIKDMLVPKSSNNINSNVTTMMIKGMGETTAEGTPIVVGNTLSGNIKMVKGVSNAGILIEMTQKENGDYVAGYTDKNGDFLLGPASDSLHTASINGVEYGAIKIIGNTKDNTETNASRKGIKENGLKKNDVETTNDATQRKGIREGGLKKNEIGNVVNEAELKQIAETLVNFRKGWDGSVKGNNIVNAANEADVKAIAETLVNLARKGWDGSIKGNKIENATKEADVKTIAETLVNIRKGWDGTVKGNKVENVANEADVKAISETLVNLRKGWDGTIKGKNIAEKGIKENGLKKNEVENSTVNGSKAIIENPNDDTGEPEQQVYKFSNGCTRTCTGNWYANANGSVGCDGTAGPLVCINKTVTTTPSATARVTRLRKRPDMKTQVFDQDGNPTDKKGWDGSIKGNIMENIEPGKSGDNIQSIHIKVTITTKVGFTDCGSPGYFFCIGVEIGALHNNQNLGDLPLEKDQLLTNANVELVNGNTIKVTSIGVKSTISEKTMSEFKNKTQKNKEFTLDDNVLKEICKALHLNTPIEPVIFKAEDQKYEVINTTNDGKEVQILEISQKTNIKIDGKEYILSMLTTSGKGLNSPKN